MPPPRPTPAWSFPWSSRFIRTNPLLSSPNRRPLPVLLKKAAGITSGSKTPNKEKVGKVTRKQVLDIVKLKMKDMNATTEEAGFRVVAGTARSMGIEVVG